MCTDDSGRGARGFRVSPGRFFLALLGSLLFLLNGPGPALGAGERLPEAIRGIIIRDHPLPSSGKKAGLFHALWGRVIVVHGEAEEGYTAKEGHVVYTGDMIYTLKGARCRVRLLTGDIVDIASNTRFGIDQLLDEEEKGKKTSVLSLLKGKAMFYALRLFKYRSMRFTVKTPTAVAGVRGTKFGIHVYSRDEAGPRVSRGVRVASLDRIAGVDTAVNTPLFTDCFSEDGTLDVNGKPVPPGRMYRGMDDRVIPTPPGYVRDFESSTRVQEGPPSDATAPGGAKEGGTDTQGGDGEKDDESLPVADSGGAEAAPDLTDTLTDTTQQQTGSAAEEGEGDLTGDISEGKAGDWVSGIALLLVDSGGQAYNQAGTKGPMYRTPGLKVMETIGSGTQVAYEAGHANDIAYLLTATENETSSELVVDYLDWHRGVGDMTAGINQDFRYFQGGQYSDGSGRAYLEWGWWEDTTAPANGLIGFDGTDSYYAAARKIWSVEGVQTHPDYIDYLHQQGAVYDYSGGAKGIYGSSAGPGATPELSGTFSCQIDFGNRQISNLDIAVNGGGVNVHLNGGGTIEPDGTFGVTNMTGTIAGSPVNPMATLATGACFGSKAGGVAGLWNAHDGGDKWATGEFHGER